MLDSFDPTPRGFTYTVIGTWIAPALASIVPSIMFVVGQLDPNITSGASGWAGAGILGLVLAWLFFKHLPDKDALLERANTNKDAQIKAKDEQIEKLITSHNTREDAARLAYEQHLKQILEHCEKEMTTRIAHQDSTHA